MLKRAGGRPPMRRAKKQQGSRHDRIAPMRKKIVALIAATAALSGAFLGPAVGAERVVNVFNWSDYVDAKTLDDFTRETGVKVVYDTYDSNEILDTRLLAGATGYDVVAPSATFLARQIKAGVFRPLDKSKLPNSKNLWPEIAAKLQRYDPGNQYAVDYMWYTTGIAYNAAKIKERLGDKPITSWEQVLRPENLKKFADCGVYVIDSPEDLFSITLNFLKLDPNSKNPEDIRRAEEHLFALRRYIKKFHSSEYINALANGDICLAIGWSGDSFQARNRAREAGNGSRDRLCDSKRRNPDLARRAGDPQGRAASRGSVYVHRLSDASGRRRAQHQRHAFRQWRRRLEAVDRPGHPRQYGDLSGRGDDDPPVRGDGPRPRAAKDDHPRLDAGEDRTLEPRSDDFRDGTC